jgi:hypothetical protein
MADEHESSQVEQAGQGGQTDPYDGTGVEMTTGEAAANAPADAPADEDAAAEAEAAAQAGSEAAIAAAREGGTSPAAAKLEPS